MKRWHFIALCALMLFGMASCVECQDRTHNAAGGYKDACGDLPPLVGDDC